MRAWLTSKLGYLLFSLKGKSQPGSMNLVIPRAQSSQGFSNSHECQTSSMRIDYRGNWQSSLTGGIRHLISSGLYFGEMQGPPSHICARHCLRKQILWMRKRNQSAEGRKLKTFSSSHASLVLVISLVVKKITHMVSAQRQYRNIRKIPTTNSAQVFQDIFFHATWCR